MRVYTSLPPSLERAALGSEVGPSYLSACIGSWRAAGFDVVSINNPAELPALHRLGFDVTFRTTARARPSIAEIIAEMRQAGDEVAGLINADCLFLGTSLTRARLADAARRGVVLIERLNVDPETMRATGRSCFGFDAFLFNAGDLAHASIDPDLRLGDTWWDYWLPLSFAQAGLPLLQSRTPLLLHLDHPQAWSTDRFLETGQTFFARFHDFVGLSVGPGAVDLLDEDLSRAFGALVFDWLNAQSGLFDPSQSSDLERMRGAFWLGLADPASLNFQSHKNIVDAERLLPRDAHPQRPAHRRFGELLCTLSQVPLRLSPDGSRVQALARRTFERGAAMQRRHVEPAPERRAYLDLLGDILALRKDLRDCPRRILSLDTDGGHQPAEPGQVRAASSAE